MRIKIIVLVCFNLGVQSLYSQKIDIGFIQDEMSWWYNRPATKYWEGLPIGTGRFAGMVLGKTSDVFNFSRKVFELISVSSR